MHLEMGNSRNIAVVLMRFLSRKHWQIILFTRTDLSSIFDKLFALSCESDGNAYDVLPPPTACRIIMNVEIMEIDGKRSLYDC